MKINGVLFLVRLLKIKLPEMQIPSSVLCQRLEIHIFSFAWEHYPGRWSRLSRCTWAVSSSSQQRCFYRRTEWTWPKTSRRKHSFCNLLAESAENNEGNLTAGLCSHRSSCKLVSLSKRMVSYWILGEAQTVESSISPSSPSLKGGHIEKAAL